MKAIYPSSLLKAARVDEHFAEEAESLSNFPVVYSIEEQRIAGRKFDVESETLLYRGWILTPEQYADMEAAVSASGGTLLVSTEEYVRTQFGDGWIDIFAHLTPKTEIFPYHVTEEDFLAGAERLGSEQFVLKGASKSVKHDWENSMFAPNKKTLVSTLRNFRKHVGPHEETKLLLREFEHWKSGEARLWWVNGKLSYSNLHPQSDEDTIDWTTLDEFLPHLESNVQRLDCALITTDLAQTVEGQWRVVEVGNGQVSQPRHTFAEAVKGTDLGELYGT